MTINPNDLPAHLATLERYHVLRRTLEAQDGEPFGEGTHFTITLHDEDANDHPFSFADLAEPKVARAIVDAIRAGIEIECENWRKQVINAGFDPEPVLDNQINQLLMHAAD